MEETEPLVEVAEEEVRLDFELGCKCKTTINLRSLSRAAPVAFKVQTSSPDKFLVKPPSGLIQPLSHLSFQIVLKPQSHLPSTFPRSTTDRFLIKTALFSPESRKESVVDWFSVRKPRTFDVKLRVVYVGTLLLKHCTSNGDVHAVWQILKRQQSQREHHDARSLLEAASSCWNPKGWTAVHFAAVWNQADVLSKLLNGAVNDVDVDARDSEGRTALHIASSRGHVESVRLLLQAGARKDAQSNDGRTSLFRAAANGDTAMVELLLEEGADAQICTVHGHSPADVAREKGHKFVVEMLESGDRILASARKGDVKDLQSCLEKRKTGSTKGLNRKDQYGWSPLHCAAIKGHVKAIALLLEYGMEVDCKDNEGHTPLHCAVEGGSSEAVELLVGKGADVNAITKRGASPLYIAAVMGYSSISKFLLSRGADSSCLASSTSLSSSSAASTPSSSSSSS
ncbi:unnamed protein product [Victoria cruziana]